MSSLSILTPPDQYREKENLYIDLRSKENRVKTVDQIKKLPYINNKSEYDNEWKWREKSKDALLNYFSKSNTKKTYLELGCGNGWLANHLSNLESSVVYAVDLNMYELNQGREAFDQDNLHFVYGNIFHDIFPDTRFDYIILAASVQYFPSLTNLLNRLLQLLSEQGEIHILDTNFYKRDALEKARENTINYYFSLGMPEMNQYYYHHCLDQLLEFNPIYMNKTIQNRYHRFLLKYLNQREYHIFPWFKILR